MPASVYPRDRWLCAVALGGQGRYAAANAMLAELLRDQRTGPVASLAWSTRASLLRQTGWHRSASGLDGRALALLSPVHASDSVAVASARCDATTGLAADALGCGRLALGWRLLDRTRHDLSIYDDGVGADVLWRAHVRLNWVAAELSLACGDFEAAVRHARAASSIADRCDSIRHRVKSDLLRAAAATGQPDSAEAVRIAQDVLLRSDMHGLVPLKWAASMLLCGVTSDSSFEVERDACKLLIEQRGGRFDA